jgi:hypothetical protein
MCATSAYASTVTFSTPIVVPNTFAGVYINLLTGASGITPASVPGWDFGPWGSSSTLAFFWNGTPAGSSGGVAGSSTGPYLDLSPGTVISAASTFFASANATQAAAFQTTGTHILGFRFFNESTSAINYGYLSMSNTGPNGFPATVTGWTFENSGGAITVPGGTGGIPEPTTWALMIMGFGAMGAAMRRTRATRPQVRYAA